MQVRFALIILWKTSMLFCKHDVIVTSKHDLGAKVKLNTGIFWASSKTSTHLSIEWCNYHRCKNFHFGGRVEAHESTMKHMLIYLYRAAGRKLEKLHKTTFIRSCASELNLWMSIIALEDEWMIINTLVDSFEMLFIFQF